jgi:hypothetical protein
LGPAKFRESSPLSQLFDPHPVHGHSFDWFESDENRKFHPPKARSISESGARHTIDDRSLRGHPLGDFFDWPAGMLSGVGRGLQPRFLNRCMGAVVRCTNQRGRNSENLYPCVPRLNLSQTKLLITHVGLSRRKLWLVTISGEKCDWRPVGEKEPSVRSVPVANSERGMRRAPQRGHGEWREHHARPVTDRIAGVGTFAGTLHQNGGKWRAILLSAHIRAPSVSD